LQERFVWPDINVGTAAELLGITTTRLRQLVEDGAFEPARKGWYNIKPLVQGYVRWLKAAERRTSKSATASKLNDARAELVAIQVEERSGDLAKAALAEALSLVDMMVGELKADLLAVPARVTLDLAVRQKIEAEIEQVLREAAARAGRAALGADADSSAAETGDEADAGAMGSG